MKVTSERVRRQVCEGPGCSMPEVTERDKVPTQLEIESIPQGI